MDIPVRRRRKKKADPKLYVLIGICSVLLVALIIVAVCLSGKEKSYEGGRPSGDGSLPTLEIIDMLEQEDTVKVHTSYADLEFPYAFTELLHVRSVDGKDIKILEFYTVLDGAEYRLFDVIFGGSDGIRLGDLKVPGQDSTLPVFAKVHEEGQELSGELLTTYLAVRDCFNDVVVSLSQNEGYTPLR